MTKEKAFSILVKHEDFYKIYAESKYVPRAMEQTLNEIKAAYKVLMPQWTDCSTCNDPFFINDSNRLRLAHLKTLVKVVEPIELEVIEPVKMTFPKKKRK